MARVTKKQRAYADWNWEWTLLIGAWRYYCNGRTITSQRFPELIKERFFGKKSKFVDDQRENIARQFTETDYRDREYLPGEPLDMCWNALWDFFKAWLDDRKPYIPPKRRYRRTPEEENGWTYEWRALCAALHYYSHGGTFAASSFPKEVAEHFWGAGNHYTDKQRRDIAREVTELAFPSMMRYGSPLTEEWQAMWRFMDAWLNGGYVVEIKYKGEKETLICFKHKGEFIPLEKYSSFGSPFSIIEDYIIKVSKQPKPNKGSKK